MHKYPFKIVAMICALNEEEYIEYAIKQVVDVIDDVVVVLGGRPWNWNQYKTPFKFDRTEEIVRSLAKQHKNIHILQAPEPRAVREGARRGSNARNSQNAHRQIALDKIKVMYPHEKYRYCFWLDADEFYTKEGLEALLKTVNHRKRSYNSFSVPFRFYWRSFHYELELNKPLRHINRVFRIYDGTHYRSGQYNKISTAKPNHGLPVDQILCHHMTTCRSAESMLFKICTRAYAENRVDQMTDWYNNVFLKWADNTAMEDLHPTNPHVYKRANYLDHETGKYPFPEHLKLHPYYKMEIVK